MMQAYTVTEVHIDASNICPPVKVGGSKRVDVEGAKKVIHEKIAEKLGKSSLVGLIFTNVSYEDVTIIVKDHHEAIRIVEALYSEVPVCNQYWNEAIDFGGEVRNVYAVRANMEYDTVNDIWEIVDVLETYIPEADRLKG